MSDPRRAIPSVDVVTDAVGEHPGLPRSLLVSTVREVLDRARSEVRKGEAPPGLDALVEAVETAMAAAQRPSLRPVINATGVILQTNLGRAPLSDGAIAAMQAAARGYTNLEFDLDEGERGSRHEHVRDLIRRTTGAEDGLVVNNNAAALFMVLQVFAEGRDVIVSRGQAVEIGGGFRIPDVLRQSGARLVEVGTTNRTYASDYARACGPDSAAILRVHSSNFRVVGFTAEAALADLAALARERGILLVDDLGSGCLLATERYGLAHEPTVQESILAGADLALFSGDKLLGGPQCGVIAGRATLVDTLRRHPLARALRVDKLAIAALNATLLAYVNGTAEAEVPVWRMVAHRPDALKRRAQRWARAFGHGAVVISSRSMVGGGSLPEEGLATWCTALSWPAGEAELAARLRLGDPPLIGRAERGRVLLDPRTVDSKDDRTVAASLRELGHTLAAVRTELTGQR